MRPLLALCGLCSTLAALAAPVSIGSPTTVVASSSAVTNERPAYDFYWDMESDTPVFGSQPPVSQPAATYYSAAVRSTAAARSGSYSLYIPATSWPAAYWYNNTNARVWASTAKGEVEFWFMYPGAWQAAALFFQLGGKSQNAALDTNDAMAVRTAVVGGGNTPGFLIGALSFALRETPTPAYWYRLIYRWDRDPAGALRRSGVLYVFEPNGTITSGYNFGSAAYAGCAEWHHMLPGNDTSNAFEYYLDDFVVRPSFGYDFAINWWQDFELDTLDAANLTSRDHSPSVSQVWSITGNAARFSTTTAAQITSPSTINLQADTGTRGLRYDLSQTAYGNVGFSSPLASSAGVIGGWVRVPAMASGTSAEIAFVGGNSTSRCLGLNWKNVAGQHQFTITGSAESAGSVPCEPGIYWVTLYVIRNGTCRLQVYDTAGSQVGSEITQAGAAVNFSHVGLGSFVNNTAQSAGTYVDYDNWVYETARLYPIMPWYRP